jgi:hypothetical protein
MRYTRVSCLDSPAVLNRIESGILPLLDNMHGEMRPFFANVPDIRSTGAHLS